MFILRQRQRKKPCVSLNCLYCQKLNNLSYLVRIKEIPEDPRITLLFFKIIVFKLPSLKLLIVKNRRGKKPSNSFFEVLKIITFSPLHLIFFTPNIQKYPDQYLCSANYCLYLFQTSVGSWVRLTDMIHNVVSLNAFSSAYLKFFIHTSELRLFFLQPHFSRSLPENYSA